MTRHGVLGSSPNRTAHEQLRNLDRKIAKHIRVLKIEIALDPQTAKQRYQIARDLDERRKAIRTRLKERKA